MNDSGSVDILLNCVLERLIAITTLERIATMIEMKSNTVAMFEYLTSFLNLIVIYITGARAAIEYPKSSPFEYSKGHLLRYEFNKLLSPLSITAKANAPSHKGSVENIKFINHSTSDRPRFFIQSLIAGENENFFISTIHGDDHFPIRAPELTLR